MRLEAKQHNFYLAVVWSRLMEVCYTEFRYCITNLYFVSLKFEGLEARPKER